MPQLRWPEDGVCLFVPAIAHVEVFLVISAYPRGSPPAVGTAASRPLRRIRLPPHPRTVAVIIGGFVAIDVFLFMSRENYRREKKIYKRKRSTYTKTMYSFCLMKKGGRRLAQSTSTTVARFGRQCWVNPLQSRHWDVNRTRFSYFRDLAITLDWPIPPDCVQRAPTCGWAKRVPFSGPKLQLNNVLTAQQVPLHV